MIEEQIKPSELRIGNYYEYDKEVFRVDTLNDNYAHPIVKGCENALSIRSLHFYSQMKPIPLTEEWHVKFKGEKTNRHWFTYSYKDIEISHNIMNGVVNLFQPINSKEPITIRDIYKVHTFQNLYFALTKEELKITE